MSEIVITIVLYQTVRYSKHLISLIGFAQEARYSKHISVFHCSNEDQNHELNLQPIRDLVTTNLHFK